ncbi:MAG: hypothetical protein GX295_10380 [Syntrophomonadaceae bacterium]|nr:hypothetical protein [Syntrophomonadaceae bacterium]
MQLHLRISPYYRWLFLGAIAVLMLLIFRPYPASAGTVGMTVRPGLGGLYKGNQIVPIKVTIENPGSDLTGILRVRPLDKEDTELGYISGEDQMRFRQWESEIHQEVKVLAGQRAEYELLLPGNYLMIRPVIEFRVGNQVLAKTRLEGTNVDGQRVMIALGESILDSSLPAWVSNEQNPSLTLKYLPVSSLPVDINELRICDLMLVDANAVMALTEAQEQTLREWVYLGGWLVLFPGPGTMEQGRLADLTPVHSATVKQIRGTFVGLRGGESLTIRTGPVVAGKALIVEDGLNLVARRSLGHGQVLYCAAAPGELGKEATGVWSLLAGLSSGPSVTGEKFIPSGKWSYFNDIRRLINASTYIPQLRPPSTALLFGLWLLYVVGIGPLLYLGLRRLDRRDWAWGVIPVGALLVAVGFYLLAPSHRFDGQLTQTLATIEIYHPQLAEINAGATAVSSSGGDLLVQGSPGLYVYPETETRSQDGSTSTLVQQSENRMQVAFSDVGFGSIRQVKAYGLARNLGNIEGELYLQGHQLKGHLTNQTGMALRDAHLVFEGKKVIFLGDLPVQETVLIEKTLASLKDLETDPFWEEPWRPDNPYWREFRMREYQMLGGTERARTVSLQEQWESGFSTEVQLMAWHDGTPSLLSVHGSAGTTEQYGLTLIKQVLPLKLANGEVRIPAGFIRPRIESGKVVDIQPEGFVLNENAELIYHLAALRQEYHMQIKSLEFSPVSIPGCSLEIYNHQNNQWEALPAEGRKLGAGETSDYLTSDLQLKMRIIQKDNFGKVIPFFWVGPAVEGVVSE